MRRRHLLQASGAAGLVLAAPNIARSTTGRLEFSVWREGSEIGSHTLRFTQSGSETIVDIDIDLVVKLLFIPVYDYKHRNQERWQSGQLASFQSETDDNGDPFRVDATSDSTQIIAKTLDSEFEHPLDRRPSTYWHKNFLSQTTWIDTQKGSSVNCQLLESGAQTIDVMGRSVETQHFKLGGDLKLDLWYLGNDWVKLTFEGEDGSIIEYRIRELQPIDMSFA